MTSASVILRERHAAELARFTGHRFFLSAADGTLSDAARDRYFVNERLFVAAARAIFAHLLIKTTSLSAARHLVGIPDGLVDGQEAIFTEIFERLDLKLPPVALPAPYLLGDGVICIARDAPYSAALRRAELPHGRAVARLVGLRHYPTGSACTPSRISQATWHGWRPN